jgi:hypothetical protein
MLIPSGEFRGGGRAAARARSAPRAALVALILLVVLGAVPLAASSAGASGPRVPAFVGAPYFVPGAVYTQNFPDPSIVYDATSDKYWAFATTTGGVYVPAMWPTDTVTWTARTSSGIANDNNEFHDALPQPIPGDWSAWRSSDPHFPADLWAPGVSKIGTRWVMFYALRTNAAGRRCLAYATSSQPGGPYLDPRSFYCSNDPMGTIDPQPFTDPATGTTYLVWKDEGVPGRYGQRSWAQAITMSDPDTVQWVAGSLPSFLLESTDNWEAYTAESPSLFRLQDGSLGLFYSGNLWDSDAYATGLAHCGALTFSFTPICTRASPSPFMARRAGRKGIGGPSVIRGRGGALMLATHSWGEGLAPQYPTNQRRLTVERLYEVAGRLVASAQPGPAGPAPPAGFQPLAPQRVLDTRDGTGTTMARPLEGGESFVLDLSAKVPASTTAVTLNLTIDDAQANGFVTAYPCGRPPDASNLNFTPGHVVPNLATVRVNDSRRVCLYTYAPTHLVVDLQGSYNTATTEGFTGVSPTRILDTRSSTPVAQGTTLQVQITGTGPGAVPSGATAVALNLTADRGAADGFLTAFACGTTPPLASSANYVAGIAASNAVLVPLSPSGQVCVYAKTQVDVIIDVFGYFDAGGKPFTAQTPVRIFDTRSSGVPVGAGQTAEVVVVGAGKAPVGTTAVVLTVTAVDARGDGWVGAYPCASPPAPGQFTSNLNVLFGETRAAHVTVLVGADGKVCLHTLRPTHLLADLAGSYS